MAEPNQTYSPQFGCVDVRTMVRIIGAWDLCFLIIDIILTLLQFIVLIRKPYWYTILIFLLYLIIIATISLPRVAFYVKLSKTNLNRKRALVQSKMRAWNLLWYCFVYLGLVLLSILDLQVSEYPEQ